MKYILKLVCKIVPVSFLIFSSKSVLAAEAFCSRPEFFGTKKSVVLFILASGLMSGLNPCAIAAIFMIVGKTDGRQNDISLLPGKIQLCKAFGQSYFLLVLIPVFFLDCYFL